MVRGLLGWQFELNGVGHCRLIQRVLGCLISGLGVIGCVPLLSGVVGQFGPFLFSIVPLFGNFSLLFVLVLVAPGQYS